MLSVVEQSDRVADHKVQQNLISLLCHTLYRSGDYLFRSCPSNPIQDILSIGLETFLTCDVISSTGNVILDDILSKAGVGST